MSDQAPQRGRRNAPAASPLRAAAGSVDAHAAPRIQAEPPPIPVAGAAEDRRKEAEEKDPEDKFRVFCAEHKSSTAQIDILRQFLASNQGTFADVLELLLTLLVLVKAALFMMCCMRLLQLRVILTALTLRIGNCLIFVPVLHLSLLQSCNLRLL